MKQKEILDKLVDEILLTHSKDYDWSKHDGIPGFCAASGKDGAGITFSNEASELLSKLAKNIFTNRKENNVKLELQAYLKELRQALVDLLTNESNDTIDGGKRDLPILKEMVEDRVEKIPAKFIHITPTSLNFPSGYSRINLGPVTIYKLDDWVATTNLKMDGSSDWKDSFFDKNHIKPDISQIHDALTSKGHKISEEKYDASTLIAEFETPFDKVIEIQIEGYQQQLSYKLGKLLSKTAVDSMNLAFASDERLFKNQLISYEKKPVVFEKTLSIFKDRLLSSTKNYYNPQPQEPGSDFKKYCDSIKEVISSIVNADNKSKLSQRWTTSLDWFAEGCRESDDAIAITKMVTALDVLAQASDWRPIAEMLSNLLNVNEDKIVFKLKPEDRELSLSKSVKTIYSDSRSRFVHGNLVDKLESYTNERLIAFSLTRSALIEAAISLKNYKGSLDDKAFRTMKPS